MNSAIISATIAITTMTISLNAATAWEKLAPLPAPIGGQVCGEAGGNLVVVGGTNWETGPAKNWVNTVYLFDPATSHWRLAGELNEPYAYGLGAIVDGAFIVVGGSTGSAPFAGIIRATDREVTWAPQGGITVPAVLSASGQIGDEIFLVGGSDDAANLKGFGNKTYAWNVRTGALRSLSSLPGAGLGIATSAVAAGNLYVFGGCNWNEKTGWVANTTSAWVYLTRQNSWRALHPFPQPTRGTGAVALDDRHIYLGGGVTNDGFTDKAYIYDLREDAYRPAIALPYVSLPHLVRSGGFVYCFGGEAGIKRRSDAAYRIPISDLLRTQ
jgi:N-acetylneuraminic acid mutarotase